MAENIDKLNNIGVVVIGRNEGVKLELCLRSILLQAQKIVYVDSGSSDDSLLVAKKLGITTFSLDLDTPFTAARARNAGAMLLLENNPSIEYIQFIDGDCEMQPDWLYYAADFLKKNNNYAVICGRRRERYPEASVYNMLCDIEWDTPIGESLACGGDAFFRGSAFIDSGGFNSELIAGEEPELCFRIRLSGWKVYRGDREMTLHDANIKTFSQWWKRSIRAGYAYALAVSLHGSSPDRYWLKNLFRSILYSGTFLFIIGMSFYSKYVLFLLLIYPVQVLRLRYKSPVPGRLAWYWANSMVIGKFAEFYGFMKFLVTKYIRRTKSKIIEYK